MSDPRRVLDALTSFLQSRSRVGKIVLTVLVAGGGTALITSLKKQNNGDKPKSPERDNKLQRRMRRILPVIIPSIRSKETAYIVILGFLLTARTALSGIIAELTGIAAQYLVSRRWIDARNTIFKFFLLSIPASFVNSSLKYLTTILSLQFRVNLSKHVHDKYLNDVTFYNICNLGANRIDNVDQRITADIQKFSHELSNMYTSTFKPILDIILFTYKLGAVTGWQGPTILYSYFVISGFVKRVIMPSFGKLAEKASRLEGNYRNCHQRLITNSEEIAFYDGSNREKTIVNAKLLELKKHTSYVSFRKAIVAVGDNLLVKYWATIAGYLVMYAPILFLKDSDALSTDQLTRDYARNGRYLSNLADAVGQLVLLGNKLSALSGYASRVGELLEKVESVQTRVEPFQCQPQKEIAEYTRGDDNSTFLHTWKERCDRRTSAQTLHKEIYVGNVRVVVGENIEFRHIDIISPEGKLLVSDLNFVVERNMNVMVTGPNGAGKSSLFRVIGDLWPPHQHDNEKSEVIKPPKKDILFVPQKPYLVLGTLRDQIIYPHSKQEMERLGVTDSDLEQLLRIVDPKGDICRQWSWDSENDWFHAFSGGQKQRVAMARLFYHRPHWAILDECTSAVSDEVEDKIYETCKELGITLFTVSHRKYLRRHHDYELNIEGRGGKWAWKKIEKKAEGY